MSILDKENQRLLDVVDENDNIVDAVSRAQIHHLGLLHREVHVWMIDFENNLIFQKRGLNRDYAGLLDATVGGHVDKGEEYMDAVIRETSEETGLEISPSDVELLKKIRGSTMSKDPWGTKNNFFKTVYACRQPVDYKKLRREPGIPGVGFQKISLKFLSKLSKKDTRLFAPIILDQELSLILKYFNDVANR